MVSHTLNIRLNLERYLAIFIVIFIFFTWRQMTLIMLNNIIEQTLINEVKLFLYGVYYIPVAVFIILSSILLSKYKKLYIRLWLIPAIASCIIPTIFGFNFWSNVFYLLFAGLSVGFGVPICLAFFADNTLIQNRGRIGAIIFFLTILSFAFFGIVADMITAEEFTFVTFLWAFLSLVIFSFLRINYVNLKDISFKVVLTNKQFLFYFASWCMFCFVDLLEGPILRQYIIETFEFNFLNFLRSIETVIAAFATLLAGFLVDNYGRKKTLIYGFIILGIAYATIGVFPLSEISWYLYSIIYGIASGIFVVTFVFTIWGDLSQKGVREKYYALGSLPFFLIIFIQRLITPYILEIPVHAAFSFASFFLFLAVWPLVNAPETLPEKEIRRRELKKYVEKAKKLREKYEKGED